DLVLSGHSHIYEISFLINGHNGIENTFSPSSHSLSTSSAKYDGSANSCVYIKNPTDIRNGIVYAVVGSAGQLGGTSTGYPHNAMYYSNATNGGTLFFEVENNRLDAKWIGADGVIRDNFTIMKQVNKSTEIAILPGASTILTASWIGNYSWSTGATTRSITVNPTINTIYTVSDGAGCLTDAYNITMSANKAITLQKAKPLY
ncbi:MAG: metallophosphoesterase, partial [Chitinophagaceae bacterium]